MGWHRIGERVLGALGGPAVLPGDGACQRIWIRWTTEENFQASKGLAGLDEHQVRRWCSWYRRTTLALLALAFLSITAAAERTRHPSPAGQIPLTRNEIAALFATLPTQPVRDTQHCLRWSVWRRCRQHRAKTCHYQRQAGKSYPPLTAPLACSR